MRCQKCGQENPAEAKFCGKCATRLSSAEPPIVSPFSGPASGNGGVSQGLKVGVIVGTVFIPLLGIIMGLIYMNDANLSKKATGKTWLKVGVGLMVFYAIVWMVDNG
jgi:hypothetical protein